jgi:hypothetical protein
MTDTKKTGMILFRENAVMPPDLAMESEDFVPGWRIITNLDAYALRRKLRESNWNFTNMSGEGTARVLGRTGHDPLLKGVQRILAGLRGRRFNSLEITVVTVKRLFGMTYLNISAGPRHFQEA